MTNQGIGLMGFLIILIVALIVLGYFGISIKSVIQKQPVQDNLSYAWQTVRYVWTIYLSGPANYIWGIFYNYLWLSFIENAQRIKDGKLPTFIENQPKLTTPSQ